MRSVEPLLVNKGIGRGSCWSSLDLETLEGDVSTGKPAGAIAKDRGWPSSKAKKQCVINVLRQSSEEILLHVTLLASNSF